MIFLDDEFPDHPKTVAAGPEAAMLLVALLGYSNRYLTGGHVPAEHPRLTSPQGRKAAARLIEVRYLHGPGHDCDHGCPQPVDDGYVIHDYDEKNSTALAKAEARKRRARNAANARHHGRKPDAPGMPGADAEHAASNAPSNGGAPPQARPPRASAHAVPTPTPSEVRDPVSSSPRGGPPQGDDDGTRHTLDEAFELLARRLLEQRNAELVDRGRADQVIPLDKPARVRAWISETANGERSHFEAVARAYLADNPEMAADELAEALAPELVLADAGSALA